MKSLNEKPQPLQSVNLIPFRHHRKDSWLRIIHISIISFTIPMGITHGHLVSYELNLVNEALGGPRTV